MRLHKRVVTDVCSNISVVIVIVLVTQHSLVLVLLIVQ